MDGFGRRKRNFSHIRQENNMTSIEWEHDDLEEGLEYEEVEEEEEEDYEEQLDEANVNGRHDFEQTTALKEPYLIDGKPFVLKQQPKKPTFNESHVRITTYLEKNTHQIIRMLQKQGQIESITSLVNESIKAYLLSEFHDRNSQ